jgi:dolichol-phosphate mannosyltransferase
VRFCVVGTSGYLVNLAVFATLHVLDVHYAAAAVASFCVAWAWNFALNRSWTFRAGRQRSMLAQGARYLLVSGLALGANLGILHLLVQAGLPEIPAQAIAIVAVTPVSFLANRRWSFR